MKINLKNRSFKITFLVLFVCIFVLNLLVVPTCDDLGYCINNGFMDILHREYIQYMTWTGRTVAHLIARTFLAMPKIVFDICNTACFMYLMYVICNHAQLDESKISAKMYAFATMLTFLTVPFFGQTCLWETGSCNYLFTTTIVFSFLLVYRKNKTQHKMFALWMFLFGIVAGWTNENTGGALILMLLLMFIASVVKKQKREVWMYTGFVGALLGFSMLVLAPGNKVRAQDFVNTNGFAYTAIHDFTNSLDVFSIGQVSLWILFAIGIAILIQTNKHKEDVILASFYALCALAAVFAIMLSPVPVLFDRSMFGATIFLIVAILICYERILNEYKSLNIAMSSMIGVLALYAIWNYAYAIADLGYTKYQYKQREAYVMNQKAQGNLNPVVPEIYSEFYTSYNPMYGLGDLTQYPNLWVNKFYAEVHSIETVQSTPLENWKKIYENGDPELMNLYDMKQYLKYAISDENLVILVSDAMDQSVNDSIKNIMLEYGIDCFENTNVIAIFDGNQLLELNTNDGYIEAEMTLDGHYIFATSSDNAVHTDVLVDNIEYTNDCDGITIVVFNKNEQRVVDSVSFNKENGLRGIRRHNEK